MTRAEILTIGTELLLGEIVDTNTRTIAIALRENGFDLFRTATVGDNPERIALAVSDALEQSEILIAAGGLGPTVDDVTREGVAQALGLALEFREDLWGQIEERFEAFGREPTENNRRQATLPEGSIGIENPVGTAPGFISEKEGKVVIALPGVPAELEYLLEHEVLPYLRARLKTPAVIKSRTVRTAGIGESWLDERIQDLERMTNPTVGLAAHPGRVDIRITAKAGTEFEADEMLWGIEATLQQRLGDRIYGTDDETLELAAMDRIRKAGWRLATVEVGTDGVLAEALAGFEDVFAGGELLPEGISVDAVDQELARVRDELDASAGLGLHVAANEENVEIQAVFQSPEEDWRLERSFGGAAPNAARWAISLALEAVRRRTMSSVERTE
ncbi:MAG: CinA family nicotinamide mononucleotide deamidase-related protein [Anaerolineae bacterium]|nr:MAG: CinA family nicotinamide mononucleotide deamidase-related protein [Anaerolineae bacterium]